MAARRNPTARLSLVQLLPNAMTLAALCAGLTAIRFAMQDKFDAAIALILLAAILDGLDGRLARRLSSESPMGAELDSLCDFVDFGVAPALVIHLWAYGGAGGIGWIAALLYAVACALRLARFNIGIADPVSVGHPRKTFSGVPSPAAAMLALLPLFVSRLVPGAVLPGSLVGLWLVVVAGLMVTRLPTPAPGPLRIRQSQAPLLLLGMVALGAALLTYPWLTLVVLDLGYLMLLLVGWVGLRRRPTRKEG